MARILSRVEDGEEEHTKGWVRFMVSVDAIYKKGRDSRIKRGTMTLVVPVGDLACKCPKIKNNKWVTTRKSKKSCFLCVMEQIIRACIKLLVK